MMVPVDNGLHVAGLEISSFSPSGTSFLSTKSSGTCGSSSITFSSLPPSAALSPYQSGIMETAIARQIAGPATTSDHAVDVGEPNRSQNQFGFCENRFFLNPSFEFLN